MHAVVAHVRVTQKAEARAALATLRLPVVERAPGLVAGYWLEPVSDIGMSVLVFETKDAAEEALQYPLPPLPGVTPMSVEVREVYASV